MIIGKTENPVILSQLEKVVRTLDSHQLPYYIVGNTAIDAIIGKNPNRAHRRFDGTSGDIDILTPNPRTVGVVLREACFKEGILEALHLRNRQVDLGINNVVDLTDPNNPRLRYKSIDVSVPREVFVANYVTTNNLSFRTLPAETLFHLYYLSWSLQNEVGSNTLALKDWIVKHPNDNLPANYYTGFIEYHMVRQDKYHLRALAWQYFSSLKYRIRSKINLARGIQPND